MPRRRRHGGGRAPSLAGTGLHRDPRTGIYVWRRTNPLTGRREKHSTGARVFAVALKAQARLEADHEQRRAGIDPRAVDWKADLGPLVEDYAAALAREGEGPRRESTRVSRLRELRRALDLLDLRRAADLRDVAAIDARTRALEGPDWSRKTLRRAFQDVLKAFTKWLSQNGRHLDRDPLAAWGPIKSPPGVDADAFDPEHVARALVAAGWLDVLHARKGPQRPVLLAMLVTGARAEALLEVQAEGLDEEGRRLQLGEGVGNKRRGVAALDPATLAEFVAYRGPRRAGPLFLGADGSTTTRERLLDVWKEALGLGHVWRLWPVGEPWSVERGALVARALSVGRVSVSRGGNPKRVRPETLAARAELAAAVERVAEAIREPWAEAMRGATMKALRATCRTWAMAEEVHEFLIDLHLGHEGEGGVGRKHYTDRSSPLFDVGRVPAAVRRLLDEALARLGEERRGAVVPKMVPTTPV